MKFSFINSLLHMIFYLFVQLKKKNNLN
ncbi:CLUMA_CG018279, isoform A [Clunio marinus]|uniref:CLUMA_CG018279, isoform A n=1 Tax=Clunio marinus TaxID=568069 RepID=A0A1J1IZS9_9DIPT|nr:CLUMA_CG018279, isoform A [Clunio marinus]